MVSRLARAWAGLKAEAGKQEPRRHGPAGLDLIQPQAGWPYSMMVVALASSGSNFTVTGFGTRSCEAPV